MQTTQLILVGGFLGAGKTTLMDRAAERLAQRGKRVGLITNDQAAHLVDTAVLRQSGLPVLEVSGGCFCCRFEDLMSAADRLFATDAPDVLLGEPVGSCTDLSATVLQPIKERYAGRFRIAPFSVLLDAPQAPALWTGRTEGPPSPSRFPADVAYIYRKQLEEADLLVLNKADLLTPAELAELDRRLDREFPRTPRMAISALRGDGVGAWLDWVLEDRPAGRTIAEVDYDQYAAGEAALGWLNAAVRLEGEATADWGSFCLVLLDALKSEFRARSAEIAHLKLHLITPACSLTANLTGNQAEPSLRVADGSSTSEVRLVLNARAHIGPEALEALVRGCLASMACGKIRIVVEDLRAFSPARPQPTHRYRAVTP